jgi:hypothetical protein
METSASMILLFYRSVNSNASMSPLYIAVFHPLAVFRGGLADINNSWQEGLDKMLG